MNGNEFGMALISAPSDKAEGIARVIVERKLAACAQITPEVTSLYWWKGELESDRERLLFLKTERSFLSGIRELLALIPTVDNKPNATYAKSTISPENQSQVSPRPPWDSNVGILETHTKQQGIVSALLEVNTHLIFADLYARGRVDEVTEDVPRFSSLVSASDFRTQQSIEA